MADVRIGEEAEAEYAEALAWYHARSTQAAERFEAAFAHALLRIGESPDRFPSCDEEGYRYYVLERYPYLLIYRIMEDTVQVIAVAHARRKPGYWTRRN